MKPPILTDYERKVFDRFFVPNYKKGFHFRPVQLEGNARLPVVAAGLRLERKGVIKRIHACHWTLTDLGIHMIENPT